MYLLPEDTVAALLTDGAVEAVQMATGIRYAWTHKYIEFEIRAKLILACMPECKHKTNLCKKLFPSGLPPDRSSEVHGKSAERSAPVAPNTQWLTSAPFASEARGSLNPGRNNAADNRLQDGPCTLKAPGTNIQYPFSRLILYGVKIEEVRKYALRKPIIEHGGYTWIVETPGEKSSAAEPIAVAPYMDALPPRPKKAQIIGLARFTHSSVYKDWNSYDEARQQHCIHPDNTSKEWQPSVSENCYAWHVAEVKELVEYVKPPAGGMQGFRATELSVVLAEPSLLVDSCEVERFWRSGNGAAVTNRNKTCTLDSKLPPTADAMALDTDVAVAMELEANLELASAVNEQRYHTSLHGLAEHPAQAQFADDDYEAPRCDACLLDAPSSSLLDEGPKQVLIVPSTSIDALLERNEVEHYDPEWLMDGSTTVDSFAQPSFRLNDSVVYAWQAGFTDNERWQALLRVLPESRHRFSYEEYAAAVGATHPPLLPSPIDAKLPYRWLLCPAPSQVLVFQCIGNVSLHGGSHQPPVVT